MPALQSESASHGITNQPWLGTRMPAGAVFSSPSESRAASEDPSIHAGVRAALTFTASASHARSSGLVVLVNPGGVITPNSGSIFTESPMTASLTDRQIADQVGLSYTTIQAVRSGIPDWRFGLSLVAFCRAFSLPLNPVKAAYASAQRRVERNGAGTTAYQWGVGPSSSFSGYYGLRDAPQRPSNPPGVTYTSNPPWQGVWSVLTDWTPLSPYPDPLDDSLDDTLGAVGGGAGGSQGIHSDSLLHDPRAFWTVVQTKNGKAYITLDGRDASPFSYDLVIGSTPNQGTGSGGDLRIDEFEIQDDFGQEDEERFALFGFTLPSGATASAQPGDSGILKVHPTTVRIMSPDPYTQFRSMVLLAGPTHGK